jgi:pyruvate-ferredoxin/flavodoxin oxidoreductase
LVADLTGRHSQGYFVYDSKKSGSMTVSHLRFDDHPIRSTYLIASADLVAVHQFGLLERMDVLELARPGATVLLNSPYGVDGTWDQLPVEVQEQIIEQQLVVHVIDAHRVAREAGLNGQINTVMQVCFFAVTELLALETASDRPTASAVARWSTPTLPPLIRRWRRWGRCRFRRRSPPIIVAVQWCRPWRPTSCNG